MKKVEGNSRHMKAGILVPRLVFLFLLAITVAALVTRPSLVSSPPAPVLVASNSATSLNKGMTIPWYFRNNQWSADMRTLAGMLHYIAESPDIAQTNSLNGKSHDA